VLKKVLFCATIDNHFKGFHLPYLKWFKEQGWEVHVAAAGDMNLPFVDKKYNIPIQRSPFQLKNRKAYIALKAMIDQNDYRIIHCHTPMGGVLARLGSRKAKKQGTRVIYTAHGFHFCKGAPLLNWLIYYPIEKMLAHFTDCLITINKEDYHLALKKRFKASRIERVHGVGVNTDYFKPVEKEGKSALRKENGYNLDDFLMFYAAEFNKNKNQQFLIHSLALLKERLPNAKLLLAGDGPLLEHCRDLAVRLGIREMVDFLGFRNDIGLLIPMCDVAVASSLREGLPVNIMEAMACGLPIVATQNRGHNELIQDTVNGYIISPKDRKGFATRVLELSRSEELRKKMGEENVEQVKKYAISQVSKELGVIYKQYMLEDTDETESQYNRAYL
jgi:glycosyltransferase EpsD